MAAINEWIQLFSLLMYATLVIIIARAFGFFSLPSGRPRTEVSLAAVIGGFAVVLVTLFILMPLSVAIALVIAKGAATIELQQTFQDLSAWGDVAAAVTGACAILLFLSWLHRDVRKKIWWGGNRPSLRTFLINIGMGLIGLLVALPVVLAVGGGVALLMEKMGFDRETQQVAVERLQESLDRPALALISIVSIVVIVPLLEEILYRGLFQSFLEQHLSRFWTITSTAAFFALSHFSLSQGARNVELLTALFLFGGFLGFIYERQRVLWAPIAMHSAFNLINVFRLIFEQGG